MAERDQEYMNLALDHAAKAALAGEVPVGAILVAHDASGDPSLDRVVAESGNLKEAEFDPLGHAELRVIQAASRELRRWRLHGCTLYVTLEPCVMCAGAIVHSRVDRVVYGARDPKAGAVESLFQILSDTRLNHRPEVQGGIESHACGEILSRFLVHAAPSAESPRYLLNLRLREAVLDRTTMELSRRFFDLPGANQFSQIT